MIERARTLAVPGTGFAVGLVMVGVYFVLRTLSVPEPVLLAWIAAAVVLTLASPLAGLTMLAALGPFTEAQTADGRVTAVPYLLAATGLALVVHVVVDPRAAASVGAGDPGRVPAGGHCRRRGGQRGRCTARRAASTRSRCGCPASAAR